MADQSFDRKVGSLLEDAFASLLVVGDIDGKKSSVRGIIGVTELPTYVPISNEQFADAQGFGAAIRRYLGATDDERAAMAVGALAQRIAERQSADRRPLTLDAVLDKLGFSHEYAEHLVQPYCQCSDGMDGWDYCQHARDEGLVPNG